MFDAVDVMRLMNKYNFKLYDDTGSLFSSFAKDLEQLFDEKLVKVIEDQSGNGFELLMVLKEENSKLQDRIKYLETNLNDLLASHVKVADELKKFKEG